MIESTLLKGAKDGIKITVTSIEDIALSEQSAEYVLTITVEYGYAKTEITKTVTAKLS